MKLLKTLPILLIFIGTTAFAKQYNVSGRVVDGAGAPVEFASVIAVNDSIGVRTGAETDSSGLFSFNVKGGSFYFEISLIGYEKHIGRLEVTGDIVLPDITLTINSEKLKGASVTASKANYDISGYNMKVNGNALFRQLDLPQVLSTAPGIFISDNALNLYGKSIQKVYINRRLVKLSGAELVSFLRSYQGANIEDIEVVSNPSLIEEGGYMIKIKTVNDEGGFSSIGLRTVFNADKLVINPNGALNYRRGKLSLYANAMYQTLSSRDKSSDLYEWTDGTTALNESSSKMTLPASVRATLGIGYDLTKNDFISGEANYSRIDSRTAQTYDYQSTKENYKRYVNFNSLSDQVTGTLMYVHTFKDRSELETKADYVGKKNSTYRNDSIPAVYSSQRTYTERNEDDFNSYLFSAKYTKSFFGRKDNFGAALRYSSVNDKLHYKYGGESSSFNYNENVANGIVSYSYNFDRLALRGGANLTYSGINDNSYFNFIPEISASWFLNKQKGTNLNLSYTRSLSRPHLSNLNPNKIVRNGYDLVYVGNPDLKPYMTDDYSLRFTLLNNYTLTANCSRSSDVITSYIYSGEDGTMYCSYLNGAYGSNMGIGAYISAQPWRWWNIDLSVNADHRELVYKNTTVKNNELSFNLMSMIRFASFTVNITATGSTPTIGGLNFKKSEPPYINISISRPVFKRKFTVALQMSDLANSDRGRTIVTDMGTYTRTTSYGVNSRTIGFSITWNSRWGKPMPVKRAKSDNTEVLQRLTD